MSENTTEARSFLTFRTAGRMFACDFRDIIRIEPADRGSISPAPGFPDYMPGTAMIDGEVIPVIDTSLRFGIGDGITGIRSCYIIARLDSHEASADRYDKCAALVDEVCGSAEREEVFGVPALNSDSFSRYVTGTFLENDETYYIISPEKLVGD